MGNGDGFRPGGPGEMALPLGFKGLYGQIYYNASWSAKPSQAKEDLKNRLVCKSPDQLVHKTWTTSFAPTTPARLPFTFTRWLAVELGRIPTPRLAVVAVPVGGFRSWILFTSAPFMPRRMTAILSTRTSDPSLPSRKGLIWGPFSFHVQPLVRFRVTLSQSTSWAKNSQILAFPNPNPS